MFKKVLIPVDISVVEDTQKLLKSAKTLTAPWACELHVVTVTPDFGTALVGSYFDKNFETQNQKNIEVALKLALETAEIAAQSHILTGTIYDRVIALAKQLRIDLIVIGAHRPELRDYLLGSNAARLVRHSDQSVIVLRN